MFKPGKTKTLTGYCLQFSAEKDGRTWERKGKKLGKVCLRQNN